LDWISLVGSSIGKHERCLHSSLEGPIPNTHRFDLPAVLQVHTHQYIRTLIESGMSASQKDIRESMLRRIPLVMTAFETTATG
jgi:predicted DNA-binding protein (UPF0278 family)